MALGAREKQKNKAKEDLVGRKKEELKLSAIANEPKNLSTSMPGGADTHCPICTEDAGKYKGGGKYVD